MLSRASAGRRTLALGDGPAHVAARAFASSPTVVCDAALAPGAVEGTTSDGILGSSMAAIDALHSASGLPWWASIAALAVGVRVAMLPISLQGMKASGALVPLMQQARQPRRQGDQPAAPSGRDGSERQEVPQPQSLRATLQSFHKLRAARGAPHPAWILASPLLQLPVFITAMASIRTMSLAPWPGLDAGGAAWFSDLTLPALDLSTLTAPMGAAGIVLPVTIALTMHANIDAAFSAPARQRQPGSAMPWVLGKVRLALEWAVVPLFVACLQLPQGALCYWSASSACALAQNHLLKVGAVRRALGLPTAGAPASPGPPAVNPAPPAAAAALAPDAAAAIVRAAELQASGRSADAAAVLHRLLHAHPEQPRALFALAQVQSSQKDWPAAEQNYLAATRLEGDAHQRARAWFGAGVALHMQEEEEAAADAFAHAARDAGAAGSETTTAGRQLGVRALVSQATIAVKAGRRAEAVGLLRAAAVVEPRVEQLYLRPLLEGRPLGGVAGGVGPT